MYSDTYLLLFTPNLVSILIWTTAAITLVPYRFFWGSCLWLFILFLTYFYFPSSQPYADRGVADSFGEAILYMFVMAMTIFFGIWILIVIINEIINSSKKKTQEKLMVIQILNQTLLTGYGILLGFWIFLFFTNLLEEYQPAWEAYIIAILFIILFLSFFKVIKNNRKYRKYIVQNKIYFFTYSLLVTIIFSLIISFSFSIIANIETKKVVQQYPDKEIKYCIQNLEMNTWLDLTPLVTWHKPTGYWGAGTNHAILVVQSFNDKPDLYNWSYKLRKWDYNTKGFKPSAFTSPSSLRCILKEDYIHKIPFIFPKNN
ncbi:MAG: hypothetical protein Tsb0014_27340 [Pleurocapsa sp.]